MVENPIPTASVADDPSQLGHYGTQGPLRQTLREQNFPRHTFSNRTPPCGDSPNNVNICINRTAMQETVVSEFYRPYYLRGICGALLFPSAAAYMFYLGLFGNLATPLNAFGFGAMFLAAACIFFYFFTKSWKRVTVTPTEIEVYNVVLNKRFTIPYADIKEIGTYRRPGYTRFGNTFARH